MKVLVTGRAGSGKSTVAAELQSRGYSAYDSDDVPGLSSWQDRNTGELISLTDNTYVNLEQYRWVWNETKVTNLLIDADVMFLCGGADNDLSFYNLFDKHFVLNIKPALQITRLQTRTNNDYGKDPRMFETIITKEANHVADASAHGAIVLDASQPIEQIVNEILANL